MGEDQAAQACLIHTLDIENADLGGSVCLNLLQKPEMGPETRLHTPRAATATDDQRLSEPYPLKNGFLKSQNIVPTSYRLF